MNNIFGNHLTCIYGSSATGKTNICLLQAANTSKKGKVFFIDTENTFSPERIKDFNGNLDNILVLKPKTFKDQCNAIESLLKLKNKASLVIIDSLSMHYRHLIQQKADINAKLSKQLSILTEIAKECCPVIFTAQVYTQPTGGIMPVGGNMIKNWSSAIIKLEQDRNRKIVIEKHPEKEKTELMFEINQESIDFN